MSARNYAQTIGAGATITLPAGRYFFIRTAAAALDIVCRGNAGSPVSFTGIGAGSKFGPVAEGQGWRFMDITSATAQNVEIIVSDDGNFEVASTVTVSGSVTTAEAPGTVVQPATSATIAATSSLDFAADLTRKRITICNLSYNTTSIFVRDQGGTGPAGVEVQPGQNYELKNTGAFRVRNASAAGVDISTFTES